jgi:hypothetical protein
MYFVLIKWVNPLRVYRCGPYLPGEKAQRSITSKGGWVKESNCSNDKQIEASKT